MNIQTRNSGKTYSLRFEYGDKHKDYIFHLYDLFKAYVISEPVRVVRVNKLGNEVVTWTFRTVASELFTPYGQLFYPLGVKIVPIDLILTHLTPIGLAYWFCDDGGKLDYTSHNSRGLVFNTQSFTEVKVDNMIANLSSKFNLTCYRKTKKGKFSITMSAKYYNTFMFLAGVHIHESMRFKLPKSGKI